MKRRDFFERSLLTGAVPALQAAQPGGKPTLKITDIKTILVGTGGRNT